MVGCIRDGHESEFRELTDNFVEWCSMNHLPLSINKTKELGVDCRRGGTVTRPVTITEKEVGIAEDYDRL